jgi:hypothetical protein
MEMKSMPPELPLGQRLVLGVLRETPVAVSHINAKCGHPHEGGWSYPHLTALEKKGFAQRHARGFWKTAHPVSQ